mmetsp:Transcript_450/g.640  ORF Transcript_450/g.640 Transcript_450/m.640 type:complete len:97 (-) Transcript_450:420-710(-)
MEFKLLFACIASWFMSSANNLLETPKTMKAVEETTFRTLIWKYDKETPKTAESTTGNTVQKPPSRSVDTANDLLSIEDNSIVNMQSTPSVDATRFW